MDKSLKEGEDEWREKERMSTKFYVSNEIWTLKYNSQMIKVEKMYTQNFIYSVTQNWREIWISIQISLEFEFEFEFVEPNFH